MTFFDMSFLSGKSNMELTTFLQELIVLTKESKQTKVALERLAKDNDALKVELHQAKKAATRLIKENNDLKEQMSLVKRNKDTSSGGPVRSMPLVMASIASPQMNFMPSTAPDFIPLLPPSPGFMSTTAMSSIPAPPMEFKGFPSAIPGFDRSIPAPAIASRGGSKQLTTVGPIRSNFQGTTKFRGPRCVRCNHQGHQVAQCRYKYQCKRCKFFGHWEGSCRGFEN